MSQVSQNMNELFSAYWNEQDFHLNEQHAHVPAVHSQYDLQRYYHYYGININNRQSIAGLQRYIMDNDGEPIAKTLQGAAYSATDIVTGRRVIIKRSNKQLVKSCIAKDGTKINEDIRREAAIMNHIATHNQQYTDSYISRFVEFFKTDQDYFLVAEHGGVELFDYVTKNHPNDQNNTQLVKEWTHNVRCYFRMIARAVYYMHVHCNVAHLDISLENTVIDTNTNTVRIIDFGLAKHFEGDDWSFGGVAGKLAYHSPEMRKIYNHVVAKNRGRNGRESVDQSQDESTFLYDARSADIWALGVMLFVMLVHGQPWHVAESTDVTFNYIISGRMTEVLQAWEAEKMVDCLALDLLQKIFQPANKRIDIKQVLNHPYVKLGARTVCKDVQNVQKVDAIKTDTIASSDAAEQDACEHWEDVDMESAASVQSDLTASDK